MAHSYLISFTLLQNVELKVSISTGAFRFENSENGSPEVNSNAKLRSLSDCKNFVTPEVPNRGHQRLRKNGPRTVLFSSVIHSEKKRT